MTMDPAHEIRKLQKQQATLERNDATLLAEVRALREEVAEHRQAILDEIRRLYVAVTANGQYQEEQ